MRLEYGIEMSKIGTPRFAVEAVEGIGKLFSLATLAMNILEAKDRIEIVFHGLNPEDPQRKIASFKEILASCGSCPTVSLEDGPGGQVAGSSSSFQWLLVRRA
jgi:hypothetical protein